jgi:hypothetical protein
MIIENNYFNNNISKEKSLVSQKFVSLNFDIVLRIVKNLLMTLEKFIRCQNHIFFVSGLEIKLQSIATSMFSFFLEDYDDDSYLEIYIEIDKISLNYHNIYIEPHIAKISVLEDNHYFIN